MTCQKIQKKRKKYQNLNYHSKGGELVADKDELKQSLTNENVEKILQYFNADYHYNQQGDIQVETICHNRHGGSHKLYYYPESKMFHCYTGCAESFDIYQLVMKVTDTRKNPMNFNESYKEIASILGINVHKSMKRKVQFGNSHGEIRDWDFINKLKRNKVRQPKFESIDESVLNLFPKWYTQDWYEEGINLETQEKFGIRFNPDDNSTVIPHRDEEGNLIGIRVRHWRYEDKGKYMPLYYNGIGYRHPLGYALYGLHENKETIKRKKKAVLVEGEKSAMKAHSYFGDDSNFVVALCGSSMNAYQADMLMSLGIEEVQIAVDKDYVSQPDGAYKNKVKKIAKHFMNKIAVYHITDTRNVLDYQSCMLDADRETVINVMKHDKYLITDLEEL